MKALIKKPGWRGKASLMIMVLLAATGFAEAQLPNCVDGNIMYASFNNLVDQSDSTEIRPVNVATGAVGSLMGGKRYWIRKRSSSSNPYVYGTAALGVDQITNRFYVITHMNTASNTIMPKDIITIDPVTGIMTTIGSTPTSPVSMSSYYFVKLAISPTGVGYAIGVHRDTNTAASVFNPLIRFTTCGGSPSSGCSSIQLLGYLPSTGNMYKWMLYNGDIAFDIYGNMYFATMAYRYFGTTLKATDARLFRIDAGDIPSSPGTGTIPMSFVADYDYLDSTGINGIALNASGHMYISTRRGAANTSELYSSSVPGVVTQVTPFGPMTTDFGVTDLASCYFPQAILGIHKLPLQYKYANGQVNLKWQVTNNNDTKLYEVQRSNDGNNFETIATIQPVNPLDPSASYAYSDTQSGLEGGSKFYRIRQTQKTGARVYSNVISVHFNKQLNIISNARPNPFVSQFDANVWLKTASTVNIRLVDQNGRTVYRKQFGGRSGENKLTVNNIDHLTPGVYILELAVNDEVLREKLIKQ